MSDRRKSSGLLLTWLRAAVTGLLAILVALSQSALAGQLSEQQAAGLELRIESFEAALKAVDMAAALQVVPPRVIEHLAAKYGVSVADVVAAGQQSLEQSFGQVTLLNVDMAYAPERLRALPDGLMVVVLPTTMTLDLGADGGVVTVDGETLGLLDGDVWYLVSLDNADQLSVLRQLYPALAEIDFSSLPEETLSP